MDRIRDDVTGRPTLNKQYRIALLHGVAQVARRGSARALRVAATPLLARFRQPIHASSPGSGDATGPHVLTPWEESTLTEAGPYTMTSNERLLATMDAVAYAVRRPVAGALVECGVWRGGSVLAMIRVLQHMGVSDRDLYLFDTFEGMTPPSEKDTSRFDAPALETWSSHKQAGTIPWEWAFDPSVFSMEAVESLILGTGYPPDRIHFVKGRVEDTLPGEAPPSIAVLRLDTDWYESTWLELVHLYPRISEGGVLIVDDYGHWDGCREAVDRYFGEFQSPMLLARIDYTGRIGVKVAQPDRPPQGAGSPRASEN